MITKTIDKVVFDLKEDFDFSFISEYGQAFVVFDKQDSGNLCFGVQNKKKKLFLKIAGAATIRSDISNEAAIERLKATVTIYEALRHPKLISLIEHKEINGGYLTVFDWFDGECMGKQYSSFDKFVNLPIEEKMNIYHDILVFHQHVNRCNYIAIDFYDGSIMYDFEKCKTMICDIELYSRKPVMNKMGRMWGVESVYVS